MNEATRERIHELAALRLVHLSALPARPAGLSWCIRHSEIADEVVRFLYEDIRESHADLPPLAIVATGGFGRRELSPYSDIDITIVPSDDASPILDQAIRTLFQDLRWAFCTVMRIDIGNAYRLISDAPALDPKSRTGLMDMRLISGSIELSRELEDALLNSFAIGEFLLSKIKEREEMFQMHHDTPMVVVPNLKEGAGGIRCFHCANWLREAIGERSVKPTPEYDHILKIRNLLHFNSKKHNDVLSRNRQIEIADQLGVDVFSMMSDVVRSGAALHAHYRAAREKIGDARFRLSKGVVAVHGEARLVGAADGGEAAVGISLATRLGLRVSDIEVAPPGSVRGAAAVYAITTGEQTLRNLDRCGLLEHLLPEVVACRTLVPADMVHQFTVYEHTMRVIRQLDSLSDKGYVLDLKESLTDLEPLYLAALLHDVGKIVLDEEHSQVGVRMAKEIGARWDLPSSFMEVVEWLIREHLTMVYFVNMRDVSHPDTVREFSLVVKDTERLKLLTLLSWADVHAVANGAWGENQESLLKELFDRTEAYLSNETDYSPDLAVHRKRLLKQLKARAGEESSVHSFVEELPAYYLTVTPIDVIRLHMGFVHKAIAGVPTVELNPRPDINATEITICVLDAPGLLYKLLGVCYAFDLRVSGIRASTTNSRPPVALDVFTVSFSGRPVPEASLKQTTAGIIDVIEGRKEVDLLLLQRGKDPSRTQEVYSYNFVDGAPGILEIRSPRGRGMPFRIARLLAEQGWNVVSARVGQWAGNAAAAFYLQGPDGGAIAKADIDRVVGPLVVKDS